MAKLSDRILGERVSGYVTKPNLLDNSNFQIHQRGTSFSGQTSSQFLSDRWNIGLTGGVVSTSAINNNSFPDSDSRYEQLFRNQTGVGTVQVQQKLAAIAKTFPSSGQLTLSFWARSGVNATTTVTPSINIVTDDGSSFIQGVAEALTATPRLITWTFDAFDWKGANTSDDSYQNVRFTMGTDAADMILADIKLEEGNTFTGYEPTPYAIDETECMKWYQVPFDTTSIAPFYANIYRSAGAAGAQDHVINVQIRPKMYAVPLVVDETYVGSVAPDSVQTNRNSMRVLWINTASPTAEVGVDNLALSCEL